MQIHQLRYACAIAETGSFSRAAELCKVAQPTLSQQILRLEEDLGAKLFDRLGRRIRLTDAGLAFLPHARSILSQLDAARASVEDKSDVYGKLAVGVIPTIAPYMMPTFTTGFMKRYPNAKLHIVEETTSVLVERLRTLTVDVCILALPLRYKDLELFTLHTEPLFVAMPKHHPLAGNKVVTIKQLRGESFAMLRDGHCFRDLSIAACARARITPNIAFESGHLSSLLGMVAAGVGVSFVPGMAVGTNPSCHYARIADSRASRTIVAAVLRGRSLNHVQQAFLSGLSNFEARR
jgi:LysR family transcriptional regulator, hydrogen peroxide-inducible genes activator